MPSVGILGAPRSGTSLTARVLNILGVDLGPEEQMLEPTPWSNPKGYWEQRDINALNDAILRTFGGEFHAPPDLPPGWERDPALDPLRARARKLIEDYFAGSTLWGWKDPRNSLTQPFWRELVPDMAFVLCVRSPADVAASWKRHDKVRKLDEAQLLGVWLQYNVAALLNSAGSRRIVVIAERLYARPEREVARLARFLAELGAAPPAERLEHALASIDAELRHHGTDAVAAAADERVPVECRSLYVLLDGLAGDGKRADMVEALAGSLWTGYRSRLSAADAPSAVPESEPPPRSRIARLARRALGKAEPEYELPEELVRGSLDAPAEGATLARNEVWVWGRVLFPGSVTSRVEVKADGRAMLARLAVPRPDVASDPVLAQGHRDAPIAGFELLVPPSALPEQGDQMELRVAAHTRDGSVFDFPPRALRLREPERGTDYDDARVARLRDHVVQAGRRTRDSSPAAGPVIVFADPLRSEDDHAVDVVAALTAADVPCTVVTAGHSPNRDVLEAAAADVHESGPVALESADAYEGRLAELAAWLAAQSPRAVLAHGLGSFPVVDLASRLELPSAWAIHESVELSTWWILHGLAGPEYEYPRDRAGEAFRQVSATVFPAHAVRRVHELHADPARAMVVPYGIDVDGIRRFSGGLDRAELKRTLDLPADAIIVVCPGAIAERSAHAQLVQAFAEVREPGDGVHLVLPGATESGSEHADALRSYIAGAGLAGAVQIRWASRAHQWYASADVVVVAPEAEDVPLAPLHAMACARPVMASRVGGLEETIEDGVNGWLWEPNDLGELIERLELALSAPPEERNSMGELAAARVAERHGARGYAAELERLIATLAAPAGDASSAVRRS